MSENEAALVYGRVWVRKSDGRSTIILGADPLAMRHGFVTHKGSRVTYTQRTNFLRKYEPKKEES